MKSPHKPVAPAHLQPTTGAWWESVCHRWALEPHHVKLLTLASEAWDRSNEAREQVQRDGLMVPTKAGGPRLHPCVKVKEQAEIAFARLLRELDLDLEAPPAASRPAPLRSMK
jgi:phage terminase small subunit